jgi:hypothetical protein
VNGIARGLAAGGVEQARVKDLGNVQLHATAEAVYPLAAPLAESMDPFDAEACRAAGDEPRHMLERLMVLSTNLFAVTAQGRVAAAMGTIVRIRDRHGAELNLKTQAAQLWLLTTTHVDLVPISTRKLIRHVAVELCKHYESLYGFIDARHERMLRLCEWIGGELADPAPFGDKAMLFRRFTLRS